MSRRRIAAKYQAKMRDYVASNTAETLGGQGYRIMSVPEEGPGTMVWRAISPAEQAKERLA